MGSRPKRSPLATWLLILAFVVLFSAFLALPLGVPVVLTVAYAGVVIAISCLLEQLAHMRQNALLDRLDELERKIGEKPVTQTGTEDKDTR